MRRDWRRSTKTLSSLSSTAERAVCEEASKQTEENPRGARLCATGKEWYASFFILTPQIAAPRLKRLGASFFFCP